MPSRILLINANRCTAPDPVFPLGLAHLSAALREAGHECVWLDSLAEAGGFPELLRKARPDYVGISLRNIDDVLIRKKETFFDDLGVLAALVRRHSRCPVILGGSGFSIFPERLMELAGADFGVTGEGEAPLLALLKALESGGEYQAIPGLVFRVNGTIKTNAPRHAPFTLRLADDDFPASLANYYLRSASMLNVQTQRGCAFGCGYCTYPLIEGRQHRRRPSDLVAEEFAQLQRLGAKYVFVVDSVFNSAPAHVLETCEALVRRNNKLPWGCFLRPQGLTRELMALMARAGLSHIEFGSDSLCDEVLAAYGKAFTFEEILNSSELAREARIDFCHFLIAGGPGETRATLAAGFANSQRLKSAVILAVVGMRIYPGTALAGQALREGLIAEQTDLLTPAYYLAPGLSEAEVFGLLQKFSRRSPNWIVGDPDPEYQNLVTRLRSRGVAGPLWSYFSMIQRLWPQGLSTQ